MIKMRLLIINIQQIALKCP
uniref:Uncharacterized protein n=1 Tax=Rhizophora mucronata TaxID=61149 RepID=A0A2P2NVV0_RHIMU